jgi:hypothetical protein
VLATKRISRPGSLALAGCVIFGIAAFGGGSTGARAADQGVDQDGALKQRAHEFGAAVKDAAIKVGHASRDAAREVAHASVDAAHTVSSKTKAGYAKVKAKIAAADKPAKDGKSAAQ